MTPPSPTVAPARGRSQTIASTDAPRYVARAPKRPAPAFSENARPITLTEAFPLIAIGAVALTFGAFGLQFGITGEFGLLASGVENSLAPLVLATGAILGAGAIFLDGRRDPNIE